MYSTYVKRFSSPMTMKKYLLEWDSKCKESTMSEYPDIIGVNDNNYFITASIDEVVNCMKSTAEAFLIEEGFHPIRNIPLGHGASVRTR